VIGFGGPGECTVTETATGGASSVTYACTGTIPVPADGAKGFGDVAPAQEAVPITDPCGAAGPQATPMTVFIEDPDQTATVTVHNTFDPITPSPAVVIQPAFTG
jgi:hypothetical protein